MKGFANQKPSPSYHCYIKELLKLKEVKGIKGGGYLPQNNFIFQDLNQASQIEVLEKNPCFEFDIIGHRGKTILRVENEGKWKHFLRANCPQQAMGQLGLDDRKEPEWLGFQSCFSTSVQKYYNTLAYCAYEKVVSVNCSAKVDGYPVQVCQSSLPSNGSSYWRKSVGSGIHLG